MTTIAEVYNLPPVHEDFLSFHNFHGCYYNHFPELQDGYDINYSSIPKDSPLRIVIHGLYNERDGRFWVIWSAWFDGKPFMLMRNAGRDGDDSAARYVTDIDLYYKALIYIKSFTKKPELDDKIFVDKDLDIPYLTSFYGNTLEFAYLQNPPLKDFK